VRLVITLVLFSVVSQEIRLSVDRFFVSQAQFTHTQSSAVRFTY